MLRQTRAKLLALATAMMMVAVAAALAQLRNPPAPPRPAAPSAAARPAATTSGEDVGARAFQRLGCAQCHSFRGVGDPSMPLDGIGLRMDRAAIADNAGASGAAQAKFSASLARRKARARSDADFERLVDYLASDAKTKTPPSR